jgi:hypothetical protein
VTRFDNLIEDATAFVAASSDGVLVLGWRLRLWDALHQLRPSDCLLRRAAFACAVATETLEAWRQTNIPNELLDLPDDLLDACRSCLNGRLSKSALAEMRQREFPRVERAAGLLHQYGYGVGAAVAAFACIGHVLGEDDAAYSERDVNFDGEPSLYEQAVNGEKYVAICDSLFDWESWESHVFASHVAAGDVGPKLDTALLRVFWIRWLQVGLAGVGRNEWDLAAALACF